VALPCELLEQRQSLRSALAGPLAAFGPLLCRDTARLQGAHGVGLRPYREPARGDAHALESHSQQCDLRAFGDRGAPRDLVPRISRRAVGRRCSSRRGQPRADLAATAPEGSGLKGVTHHLLHMTWVAPPGSVVSLMVSLLPLRIGPALRIRACSAKGWRGVGYKRGVRLE
jgi:hypothetical protein